MYVIFCLLDIDDDDGDNKIKTTALDIMYLYYLLLSHLRISYSEWY